MIRMEIALIMVLIFIAEMYFTAQRKKTLLHRTFSIIIMICTIAVLGTIYILVTSLPEKE